MSVNQFAIQVADQLGFDKESPSPGLPKYKQLGHGQYYCVGAGFGHAEDGTTGWIITVYLRSGRRNFVIGKTRGSLPRSGSKPTNMAICVANHRRAIRHASFLGIN